MSGELELIDSLFNWPDGHEGLVLGIGDDAAIIEGQGRLAVATDTLVEGVHFEAAADPEALGHKALAVNLSDLAAMGARPRFALLALTVPSGERAWLAGFAAGLHALAERHGVALVGGDLTRGPTAATVTVIGALEGEGLSRAGARAGDQIFVTGTLGDARLGLAIASGRQGLACESDRHYLLERLARPLPRVAAGLAARGLASAAIDISDGLCADLGHVLERSGVGAHIDAASLPLSAALARNLSPAAARDCALAGGEDYELLLTVPPARTAALRALAAPGCPPARIGEVLTGQGLQITAPEGDLDPASYRGYTHF